MKSKRFLPLISLGLVLLALRFVPPLPYSNQGLQPETENTFYEATVLEVVNENLEETLNGPEYAQTLEVRLETGDHAGETAMAEKEAFSMVRGVRYDAGDRIVVSGPTEFTGEVTLYAVDYVRRQTLWWLAAAFGLVVIFVARAQGVAALTGMLFSFFVIFKGILPALLNGTEPIVTVILGAALIIPVTFYLSHGWKRKTTIAVVGTLISLILTGFLAWLTVLATHLSGLTSEEAMLLQVETGNTINFQGLLLAGIIISLLGILDDVTISQASIVQELREAKRKITFTELYMRSIRVGRDHIASVINTLVLVYAGAALPLLMIFLIGQDSVSQILNYEMVAEEVVQTLVASIGLIAAIPITTFIACLASDKK